MRVKQVRLREQKQNNASQPIARESMGHPIEGNTCKSQFLNLNFDLIDNCQMLHMIDMKF